MKYYLILLSFIIGFFIFPKNVSADCVYMGTIEDSLCDVSGNWCRTGFYEGQDKMWMHSARCYGTNVGDVDSYEGSVENGCVCPGDEPSTPERDAQFVSQVCPTAQMISGSTTTPSITMKNTGTISWTFDATNGYYGLGYQDTNSPQSDAFWGISRMYLPAGSSVANNSNYTFSTTFTAPATEGIYNFRWRMVQETVAWFGEFNTPTCAVTVSNKPPLPAVTVPSCIIPSYTGSEVTISWTNPLFPVTYVDISTDPGFSTYYYKAVTGSASSPASTTGPDGFLKSGDNTPLVLQPGTTYYVALWNGALSDVQSFTVQTCVPNCSAMSGPDSLFLGQTGSYSINYTSPTGDLSGGLSAGQGGNILWNSTFTNMAGNSGTRNISWTPDAVGTFDLFCRSWNDAKAECRGNSNYVDGVPRYTCAGLQASKTVTVTNPPALDKVKIDADTANEGRAEGTYGKVGLRSEEGGSNYYNTLKITLGPTKISNTSTITLNNTYLMGTAFTSSSPGYQPTNQSLYELTKSAYIGNGFVLIYAVNTPASTVTYYKSTGAGFQQFTAGEYYIYFKDQWYALPSDRTALDLPELSAQIAQDSDASAPFYKPEFSITLYQAMGSRKWNTYKYLMNTNSSGNETSTQENVCDTNGVCTQSSLPLASAENGFNTLLDYFKKLLAIL